MTVVDPLLKAVAEECHVPVKHIVGRERWKEYYRPRHLYAYVAHTLFGDTFSEISAVLQRANHSTSQKGFERVARCREAYEPMLSRVMARFENRFIA